MSIYLIHEGNYEAFKQKVAKLERKFRRLNCPIVVNELESVFKTDDDGNINKFVKFEVEGKTIELIKVPGFAEKVYNRW